MDIYATQAPKVLSLIITFYVISIVSVTLRLVSRKISNVKFWFDDWLILTAALVTTVNLACLIELVHYGSGRHIVVLPTEYLKPEMQWAFGTEINYVLSVTFVKCSILCLYLRIFGVKHKLAKATYGLIVVVIAWGVATLLSTIFECTPIAAFWDYTIPDAHCINFHAWYIATNVPTIVIDFAILALPVSVFWNLQLSLGRRAGLIGIFMLGTVASIISIFRVVANVSASLNDFDSTWNYVGTTIYSTLESDIGIICACLPVVAPVARKLFNLPSQRSRDGSRSSNLLRGNQTLRSFRTERLFPLGEDGPPLDTLPCTSLPTQPTSTQKKMYHVGKSHASDSASLLNTQES
ncbi:MAG: hypothetical protein MMC33_000656 [Icmadophila ericetorum]|nr:hypothetical protein [Icmadophila ericetorum]